MRKLLLSLAGLSLGGFVLLTPRSSLNPVSPQGAHADQTAQDPSRRPPPIPGDPQKSIYEVKAKDGAWMICAANYTGPHSTYLAEQVAYQLREQKINAFIYNYADKLRAKIQWEAHLQLQQKIQDGTYKPRFTRIQQQTAVLIGGFKTMEDARAALPTVHQLPPPDVRYPDGEDASDRFAVYAELHNNKVDHTMTKSFHDEKVNPFEYSFVMRNPHAAQQTAQKNEVDPACKALNADEPYSLLKNKGKFTLVVKVYNAPMQYQSTITPRGKENSFINKLGFGGSTRGPGVLEATARQAQELARFLRCYKFDAYVLHMRHGSLVAVGGFKSLDDPQLYQMQKKLGAIKFTAQANLTPQTNAQLREAQRALGGEQHAKIGAGFTGQNQDAMLDPIQLLPNPMPMRVPKL
jgi:hypothetical protein